MRVGTRFPVLLFCLLLAVSGRAVTAETTANETGDRVLIYLHGKIVEDQGADAKSERFGRYEYQAILEALGRDGHRALGASADRDRNRHHAFPEPASGVRAGF